MATRRAPHSKSRLGCHQCKRRRIKVSGHFLILQLLQDTFVRSTLSPIGSFGSLELDCAAMLHSSRKFYTVSMDLILFVAIAVIDVGKQCLHVHS